MTRRVTLLLALVAFFAAANATAADWPFWRGPSNNGISAEKDWNPEAVTEGKILWRANVGKGYSSFAVVDGKAYTMGNTDDQDTVFCFDAESGKEIWKQSYPCRAARQYPGPRATPTVDGDYVYTFSREGHLSCFDAKTGKPKWQKKAQSGMPKWGIASSPIIAGKLVVVNAGTSGVAFNKKTGATAWTGGKGIPGYASPVPMKSGSTDTLLIFSAKELLCVSAKSGQKRWSFPWPTKYDVNAADPVLVGKKQVFISSGYGTGCTLLEIGSRGAKEVWRNKNMKNHMASTIFHDGYLYGFDEKILACLDAKTGEAKWTQRGLGKASLMLADGKLIMLSERGIDLVIADAAPGAYKEIARTNVLKGHSWAVPVLANGRIYCRNDAGDIACVDVSK